MDPEFLQTHLRYQCGKEPIQGVSERSEWETKSLTVKTFRRFGEICRECNVNHHLAAGSYAPQSLMEF